MSRKGNGSSTEIFSSSDIQRLKSLILNVGVCMRKVAPSRACHSQAELCPQREAGHKTSHGPRLVTDAAATLWKLSQQ